ncbi:MAG: TIGR00266 family protein [Ignavibacteriales bacterium]|nr:MAG: TIGR00266 family protein [Ignavibacteriaceae bacterium]MBW7872652.1 TIGR00266 family protein [Ignavibacteria bacterium]MCZ2142888.1 TIGR00266 family protein [Ignavibacteriales bacterium]OQY78550.1 MAG: TIGR00266 family protein [Ignavibacteriales bacterium UTCHB3]MBV6444964.1 hypothetical protein [Ignavibacteriaceae bacterium]
MTSHEIDYEIFGSDLQMVEIELDPGETVIAEAGAMCYLESGIEFEAKMGDGTDAGGFFGKLASAGKRMLAGESLFLTHFTNHGNGKKRVSFAAPYPGKIIPIDLTNFNGSILCQSDAFLCAAMGTKISIAFTQKLGAGFFGGAGFILQKLVGDGKIFVHSGGTIIKKELVNDTLRVDPGCIVAFSEGLDYSIERSGGLKTMFFGGEGLFLATLRGTGTAYVQSLPFSRLADKIIARVPKDSSSSSSISFKKD